MFLPLWHWDSSVALAMGIRGCGLLNIIEYQGTKTEIQGLRAIAEHWTRQQFWSAGEIIKTLQTSSQAFLVYAEPERSWQAFLLAQMAGDQAELLYLFVHPLYRGKGLASMLIENLKERVIRLEWKPIFLEVRPSNQKAIGLYIKHGFSIVNRRRNYYSDGEDAIIMQWEVDD